MKRIIFIIITIAALALPKIVLAHPSGIAFFKVNGLYSKSYPVYSSSLSIFNLPLDIAPQDYLIGQSLKMEIDTVKLPVPKEIVAKSTFKWDLGDGTKGQGTSMVHTYTKIGTYIIELNVDDGSGDPPTLIEKVYLNILPDASYKIPQAQIKINGRQSSDPLTEILHFKFGQDLTFDASASTATSSKIVSYFWDFGDGTTAIQSQATHDYQKGTAQMFPLLRVTDENGFFNDNYVEVVDADIANGRNNGNQTQTNQQPQKSSNFKSLVIFVPAVILLLLVAGFIFNKKPK